MGDNCNTLRVRFLDQTGPLFFPSEPPGTFILELCLHYEKAAPVRTDACAIIPSNEKETIPMKPTFSQDTIVCSVDMKKVDNQCQPYVCAGKIDLKWEGDQITIVPDSTNQGIFWEGYWWECKIPRDSKDTVAFILEREDGAVEPVCNP